MNMEGLQGGKGLIGKSSGEGERGRPSVGGVLVGWLDETRSSGGDCLAFP